MAHTIALVALLDDVAFGRERAFLFQTAILNLKRKRKGPGMTTMH